MKEDFLIRLQDVKSWNDLKNEIPKISNELNEPFFRGQGNIFREPGLTDCGWRLEPSLYRCQQESHPRYIQWLKTVMCDAECKAEIQSILERCIEKESKDDKLTITGILRHLGFPTPLLDWTKNPYIAAYFAFSSIHPKSEYITIFIFDTKAWKNCPVDLTSRGSIV